jgi:phenylalanyl-tRNA synthetase beta chain
MPAQFTVGALSKIEQAADRARSFMVGMGFQEIISNILGAPEQYRDWMRVTGTPWGNLVEVDNVMSLSFSCLRQWMLPSLLRVEAASNRAFYPHRLFEAGDVAIPDGSHELGSRTETVIGAMIAHATAHFSEIHSCLDVLFYHLGKEYSLEPVPHPSFLEGRAGKIMVSGHTLGVIGEVHPEVLERWQIAVPVVAFDVNLSQLIERSPLRHRRERTVLAGDRRLRCCRRKMLLGKTDQLLEACCILDRHVREDFAVEQDVGSLQRIDEAAVGQTVGPRRGADACDP